MFPADTLHGRARARAYFDFSFGAFAPRTAEDAGVASTTAAAAAGGGAASAPLRRVVFELADDIVPVTVANFLALATAPRGLGYVGSDVFRVQKGHALFIGDAGAGASGRSGHSAFGARYFPDENFIGRHSEPYVMAMASSGVHSNGSVFYVTLAKAPHLGEFYCDTGPRASLSLETYRPPPSARNFALAHTSFNRISTPQMVAASFLEEFLQVSIRWQPLEVLQVWT